MENIQNSKSFKRFAQLSHFITMMFGIALGITICMLYQHFFAIFVVGLTAFDGGYLKQNCNLNIHIPTKVGEYGPAEDLHMVVCGLVGSYFRKKFLNA